MEFFTITLGFLFVFLGLLSSPGDLKDAPNQGTIFLATGSIILTLS